jgi:hypothetical protein
MGNAIKKFGNKIFDGLKNTIGNGQWWKDFGRGFQKGFTGVFDLVNKAKDWVAGAYDKIKNIPVIGQLADTVLNIPIPEVGMSAKDLANIADKTISTTKKISDEIGKL